MTEHFQLHLCFSNIIPGQHGSFALICSHIRGPASEHVQDIMRVLGVQHVLSAPFLTARWSGRIPSAYITSESRRRELRYMYLFLGTSVVTKIARYDLNSSQTRVLVLTISWPSSCLPGSGDRERAKRLTYLTLSRPPGKGRLFRALMDCQLDRSELLDTAEVTRRDTTCQRRDVPSVPSQN